MFSGLIPVARELRDAKAKDSESRLDLATQLVKQAYSECPNLDLLIGAILSNPLYRCAVKRVLQRRAGSSFSRYDSMGLCGMLWVGHGGCVSDSLSNSLYKSTDAVQVLQQRAFSVMTIFVQ